MPLIEPAFFFHADRNVEYHLHVDALLVLVPYLAHRKIRCFRVMDHTVFDVAHER